MVHKNAQRNQRSLTKHTQQHNVYDDEKTYNSMYQRKKRNVKTNAQNPELTQNFLFVSFDF